MKGNGVFEACVAEDDKSDFSLACVSSVTSTDEWLCDSAYSFHMCFRKEWFFNFTELDGGVVYLADNQPCKIVGIGSISLKNHDGSDFSLACVSSVTSTDEWLCDSACSFHMCFRKEWFFNFTELDGGVVYLADNQPCKIAGIGSISLKNHDGSTRVLTDVRYIPKLEKNLISLGTLESKGFTIIM